MSTDRGSDGLSARVRALELDVQQQYLHHFEGALRDVYTELTYVRKELSHIRLELEYTARLGLKRTGRDSGPDWFSPENSRNPGKVGGFTRGGEFGLQSQNSIPVRSEGVKVDLGWETANTFSTRMKDRTTRPLRSNASSLNQLPVSSLPSTATAHAHPAEATSEGSGARVVEENSANDEEL